MGILHKKLFQISAFKEHQDFFIFLVNARVLPRMWSVGVTFKGIFLHASTKSISESVLQAFFLYSMYPLLKMQISSLLGSKFLSWKAQVLVSWATLSIPCCAHIAPGTGVWATNTSNPSPKNIPWYQYLYVQWYIISINYYVIICNY